MKIIKILFIATAIMSINTVTATESNESENKLDPYKEWETTNRQVSANLETTFGVVLKVGDFTKKEDFYNWKKACESVIANYKNMEKYNGLTEPNFDLPNDWKLNDKLYKAIKDGESVNGIDKNLATKWQSAYKAFEKEYDELKKDCEKKFSENGSPKSESNAQVNVETVYETRVDTIIRYELDATEQTRIDSIVAENKRLTEQYNLIQKEIAASQSQTESNVNAFRVCCTFPLAVKYYPNGVTTALEAAMQMEMAKTVTDPELLKHWEKYKPLLANYGKYNDEVIKYLQDQKAYMAKRGWKIDNIDVESIKRNLVIDLSGYGSHYKKEYSIKYLDYVIDKYFEQLEKAAVGKFKLSDNFYEFFIKNELTPIEFK